MTAAISARGSRRTSSTATIGDALAAKLQKLTLAAPPPSPPPLAEPRPAPPSRVFHRDHGDEMLADHEGDIHPPPLGRDVTIGDDGTWLRRGRPIPVLLLDERGRAEAERVIARERCRQDALQLYQEARPSAAPPPTAARRKLIDAGMVVPRSAEAEAAMWWRR